MKRYIYNKIVLVSVHLTPPPLWLLSISGVMDYSIIRLTGGFSGSAIGCKAMNYLLKRKINFSLDLNQRFPAVLLLPWFHSQFICIVCVRPKGLAF